MSRYIDRDFLEQRIHETMDMQDLYLPIHFIQLMDEQDAADAVKVKHGHWVYKWNPYFKQDLPFCSVCETVSPSVTETDYCPHCGSKMDEVTE